MKPEILSWNVRGINDVNKRLRIRSLLRNWKIDIVCFREMKMGFIDRSIIHSLWGCAFVGWVYLASLGALGGVLLMWDNKVVALVEESIGHFIVACSFKNIEDGWKWAFAGVYGPNLERDRHLLLEKLVGLYYFWELPWCMCRDFNII